MTGVQTCALPIWIAALVVLAIVSGYIAWYISFSDQGQWLKAKNGHSEFLLPDGSHLTLMKGSSAYFDETYGTLNRHLKVYGNAYLDIKKDTSLPFTAECGQLHLRVTGTTFFVGSGDIHSPAYVILSSGKVTVNPVSEPQKTIFLFPGQMAKILDGIPQLDTIPNPNLTAWKTLQFQFDGTPLPEALTFLAEAYNIPIRLDATFPHDCTITASFQNQTPDVILKVICSALGLQMESYKKGFRLYGEACR